MHRTNHKIGIIAIAGVTIYDGYDGVLYSGVGVKNIVIIVITVMHYKKGWIDRLKNIQISEELFFALVKYHLLEMDDVYPEIRKGLQEKFEAMVKRELYTKYKTASTEEEREKARQEYLDKVGMHRSFRW